jgi:hypothetical protein
MVSSLDCGRGYLICTTEIVRLVGCLECRMNESGGCRISYVGASQVIGDICKPFMAELMRVFGDERR